MGRPISSLYKLVHKTSDWSWTAHFKLPRIQPRSKVLAIIHEGVQTIKVSRILPPGFVDPRGLSGTFIGPPNDDDAAMVQSVIFATDPSKTHGHRHPSNYDFHAITIASQHGWTEVDENGDPLDESNLTAYAKRDIVRVIMGRNKDKYGGKAAFTLQEVRDLMPGRSMFTLKGGYLFSDQVGWDKPYGEPSAILKIDSAHYDLEARDELLYLAYKLNAQHRIVIARPWCTEVWELNV
jgi:hypothetical protein